MTLSFSQAVVTGACGFLGQVLIRRLSDLGVGVLAMDQRTGRLPGIFQKGDILAEDPFAESTPTFWKGGEQIVLFHFAALTGVGECRISGQRAVRINVEGTMNVIEACRRRGVKRIVFPSTGLVYGPRCEQPFREDDPPSPVSLYAATKLATEGLLRGYASEFEISCDTVRLSNVYGAGVDRESAPTLLLRQASGGGPMAIKTLKPVRDFIYVKDVVEGMIRLADRGGKRGFRLFNLGSGLGTSIGDLARIICQAAGLPETIQETDPEMKGSDSKIMLSIERLAQYAQWRPEWTLREGVADSLRAMRGETT